MFNIRGAFSNAVEAVHTGFARLKEGIGKAVIRLVRPKRARSRCPPQLVDPMDGLRDKVLVISSSNVGHDREGAACPDVYPMVTPPLGECPTQGVGKKGPQSARALFHDSFQPLSPLGVFEISPSAYSFPFQESGTTMFSSGEFQSPLASEASDTQFTPLFGSFNSPTEASTAPTTPDADLLRLGEPIDAYAYSSSTLNAFESEDDIPLSALMIRGVDRGNTKRNGVSGALLSKRKDVPAWVPRVVSPELGTSPSVPVETDIWEDANSWGEKASGGKLAEELSINITSEDLPVTSSPPSLPFRAPRMTSDADWLLNDPTPSLDEKSVYSLGSYVSNPSTPTQRSPNRVPRITLTPPSVPTSPNPSLYPASALTLDLDFGPNDFEFENAFGTATLLVPLHGPAPHQRDPDVTREEDDEAEVKRRRRKGCQLNTSSIDIIMAGLDQDFPETPTASPMLGPLDLGEAFVGIQPRILVTDFSTELEDIDDIPSPVTSVYPPSSPATTVRNSVNIADLSGDTLFMGEDRELESKFSDSSDDEGESRSSKVLTNVPVKYPRLSWPIPQAFAPCSALSTIIEEEEDGTLTAHSIAMAEGSEATYTLSPPAVIVSRNSAKASPFSSGSKVPKQRWFSLIENVDPPGGRALGVGSEKKHMSAPASMLGKAQVLGRAGGISLDKPKSSVRPLILPQRLAVENAPIVVFGEYGSDTDPASKATSSSGFEGLELLSLPSSRSSNCISLYQGPPQWPFYVPAGTSSVNSDQAGTQVFSPSQETETASHILVSPPSPGSLEAHTTGSVWSSPESSADNMNADDAESLGPDQDISFHLFAECPSSEYQGVGGILAILDTMNLPDTHDSGAATERSPRIGFSSPVPSVSEFGELVIEGTATTWEGPRMEEGGGTAVQCQYRDWTDSDFVAYYDGPSESSVGAREDGQ